MIIQKIKENRRTVAFIGQRQDGQIYFAFDAKNVETAQQKISEYLHPSQEKI